MATKEFFPGLNSKVKIVKTLWHSVITMLKK